jgi:hypothetical protein
VSGDTLEDVGSDMCARWGRRSNLRRKLRQGRNRRQLLGGGEDNDNEEGSIPAPNVFDLVNGTGVGNGEVVEEEEEEEEAKEQVGAAAAAHSSPYPSEHTILTGHVSRWRLQETLLSPSADNDGDASTTAEAPYYYTTWTVHYPVLQLGTYYWDQMQKYYDALEDGSGATEEELAVHTYDDDSSATAGSLANRTGASIALDFLRQELQHRVNVAIRSSDFDRTLRQGRVTTYKASVVGLESGAFVTGRAGDPTQGASNEGWTPRQIAFAVLYGLVGLIAVAATVLVVWNVRRQRALRRSHKKKSAKTKAKATQDNNGGGSTYDSTARDNERAADGRSVTSGSSFLDADRDDDPGNCWIPIPNVIRAPSSSFVSAVGNVGVAEVPTLTIVADPSRGWLHSREGEYPSSYNDPLMVLMETDDDDDDDASYMDEHAGGCFIHMDSLDEEASLVTTFTAASTTTVEVDVDTCEVVAPIPPKRVRFDSGVWEAEIPGRHSANEVAGDAGSVSSLSDAAAAACDPAPCRGTIDGGLATTHPSSGEERPSGDTAPTPFSPAVDSVPLPSSDVVIETPMPQASCPAPAQKEACPSNAAIVRQGDVAAGGLGGTLTY